MATWKRLSSEPITSESRTAVFDDAGRHGWAGVRWKEYQIVELYGPVRKIDEERDAAGAVVGETSEILDDEPTFA